MAAKQVIYITGSLTLLAALTVLFLLPGVTVDSSGNISCGPVCESYFNVTSKNKICFNVTEIVQTEPKVKTELYWLQYNTWKLFNLSKDCIPALTKKQFKITGYKDPLSKVKWGVEALGIDPEWRSTCTYINVSGTYYLDGDIIDSVTSNCIYIDSENVTFDCQGNIIDGAVGTAPDIAIYINRTNVTIQNCYLSEWATSAIYVDKKNYSTIKDTTISNSTGGIYITYSNHSVISKVSIFNLTSVFGGEPKGVYLGNSHYNNITDYNVTTLSGYHIAVDLYRAHGNIVSNAFLDGNSGSSGYRMTTLTTETIENTVQYSTIRGYNAGLDIGHLGRYINNTIQNSSSFDILMSRASSLCWDTFVNNTLTGNLPLWYVNNTPSVSYITFSNWNNNVSEIILCSVDKYILNNFTLTKSNGLGGHVLITGDSGDGGGNIINNSVFNRGYLGIYLTGTTTRRNNITNNYFNNISSVAVYNVYSSTAGSENRVYNNVFNDSSMKEYAALVLYNSSKKTQTSIIGSRTLGGNYYTTSARDGFSDTCTESNNDDICDTSVTIADEWGGVGYDYLPLTFSQLNSVGTNTTIFNNGTDALVFVNWSSTEFYLNYTWCSSNYSGDWVNTTPVERGVLIYNHSDVLSITAGGNKQICWLCYANYSNGAVNLRSTATYCNTTETIYNVLLLTPNSTNPTMVNASSNVSVNFVCYNNTANFTDLVTVSSISVDGDPTPINTYSVCTGTLNCSKYSDYQCGWCPSCLWSNKSQSAYIDLFGTPAADWAVWNATSRRSMYLQLDQTTFCTNDATDDCACFNGTATRNTSYWVYKQTDYDLTNCTAGSAWVYFSKVYETGTLETNDCMLIQYSNDSGTTWSGNTSIYCDDSPAATLNISLTNTSMYRSGFRIAIGGQAMDVATELGCVDGLIVGCTANLSCYRANGNSNTCASCGQTINCTNCSGAGCMNTTYTQYANISSGIWQANTTAPDGTIYDDSEYCTGYSQFTPSIFSNVSSSTVTVTSTDFETVMSIDIPAIKNAVYWIIVKSSSYMNKTLGIVDAQTLINGGGIYAYSRKYGSQANISANYYSFSTLYNATNYWLNVKLQGRNTAGSISWWNMTSITIIRIDDYPHRDFYSYYNASEATNLDNVFNNQGLNDVGQLTFTIAQSGLYYVSMGGSCDADNVSDNANVYATIDTAAETYPTRNASIAQNKGYLSYSEWGSSEEHYDEMFTIKNFSVGAHTINISCAKNNTGGTNITDFKDKNLYVLRLSDVFYFRNYSNGSMQTTNTLLKNLTDHSWDNETGRYIIANNVIARHLSTTVLTDFNLIVNNNWIQHLSIYSDRAYDILPYTFFGDVVAGALSVQMQFGNVTATASPTNTLQDRGVIILLNGSCPILSSDVFTGLHDITVNAVCNGRGISSTEVDSLCYGVCEAAGEKDINLSIGPPSTDLFRVTGCGPKKINYSAIPQNQTTTYGIDKLCNNGTGEGKIQVKLSGTPNAGWQIYASNTSPSENLINLTASPTTYKDIYSDIAEDECIYIWYNFTCMNVTSNAGVYEIYTIE